MTLIRLDYDSMQYMDQQSYQTSYYKKVKEVYPEHGRGGGESDGRVQAITAAMVMAMATAMTRTMMKTMRVMEVSSFRQDFHTSRAQDGVLLAMAPSDFV